MTETRMAQITRRGASIFEFGDGFEVMKSVLAAVTDLEAAASAAPGDIVWSTIDIQFTVNHIEAQALTHKHPRIMPGQSTVTASATVALR